MEAIAESPKSIPTSLKIVAWIFILEGISSLLAMVVGPFIGHGTIDLGIVNLLVGWGLLDLKAGWRTCALVFLWLTLIVTPLAGLFLILPRDKPMALRLFGMPVATLPVSAAIAFVALVFLLALWQVRVLTRPRIRALFE